MMTLFASCNISVLFDFYPDVLVSVGAEGGQSDSAGDKDHAGGAAGCKQDPV